MANSLKNAGGVDPGAPGESKVDAASRRVRTHNAARTPLLLWARGHASASFCRSMRTECDISNTHEPFRGIHMLLLRNAQLKHGTNNQPRPPSQ